MLIFVFPRLSVWLLVYIVYTLLFLMQLLLPIKKKKKKNYNTNMPIFLDLLIYGDEAVFVISFCVIYNLLTNNFELLLLYLNFLIRFLSFLDIVLLGYLFNQHDLCKRWTKNMRKWKMLRVVLVILSLMI